MESALLYVTRLVCWIVASACVSSLSKKRRLNSKSLLILKTRTNKLNNRNARAQVAPLPNADGPSVLVCFAPPVS